MTSPYLISDLKSDEGCKLHAYPDPLSGAEPWTIGYGATGPTITKNTVWTQAMADNDLSMRVGKLTRQLQSALPWFTHLSDLRQDVLVNMAYNLGLAGLLAFHDTLSYINHAQWTSASKGMLDSKWAHQLPNRSARLAEQMRTGVHA